MELRWERVYLGYHRGYDAKGHEVAEVGHVIGPSGTSEGWSVYLLRPEGELFDRYPSEETAKAAAEAAIDNT